MPLFKLREGSIQAVQFDESNMKIGMYPMLSDRSHMSELWFTSTADDGRYFLNNGRFNQNVYNGDWIVSLGDGYMIYNPDAFETLYEEL